MSIEELLSLQKDFKEENILEEDIPIEYRQQLVHLYQAQNMKINNEIKKENEILKKHLFAAKNFLEKQGDNS